MADNTLLNLGSGGDTIASDEIAAVKFQRNKITLGADGVNDGDVASGNPLPITQTELTPGVGATNLGKADDAVRGAGDVGVMALGVRNDVLGTLVDADGDYAPVQMNADGSVYVAEPNMISTDNSTTGTLGISGVYTGTGEDVSQYAGLTVMLDASHDSAVDGMTFQFSTDGANWDDVYPFSYTAVEGARRFQFAVTGQWFRVVYTNGGTAQTHFRVQTILHVVLALTSVHRAGDDVSPDRSAFLGKVVLLAQAAGVGDFTPIQATAAGNLKISVQEISDGLDIGAGAAGAETARVSIATDDVNQSAIKTAVEIMDDWDEADRAAVNPISGQIGVQGGSGGVSALTQRTVLATDVALPAGDNNIGNVDIVTGPSGASALEVQGTAADGAASAGNPVLMAGHDGSLVQNLAVDSDGQLQVDVLTVPANTALAESIAEDTNFPAASLVLPVGVQFDDAAINLLDEDDIGAPRASSNRNLYTQLRDAAGAERGANVTAANELNVIASAQPGTDIGDVTIADGPTGASSLSIQGTAAHDAAVVGNPLLNGGEARSTLPTAVADGDAVRTMHDDLGRMVVAKNPRDLTAHQRSTFTSTTEGTILAAGSAGVFRDITSLILSNESATEVRVDIRDASAGTIRLSMDLAADGGGAVISFDPPLTQATAANIWTAQLSATVSTVYITAVAIENN